MSKWKKRLLVVFAIIAVGIGAAFVFLHDDSDLDAIEKKQVESINEVTSEDNFDAIGEDYKEFEDSLENFESSNDSIK